MSGAVAFARCGGLPTPPFQVRKSRDEDENRADDSEQGSGVGCGLEKCGWNDVLDLRRAGQRIHREGECAQRDRPRNQPLRNIALPKHLGSKRIDGEDHDEQ